MAFSRRLSLFTSSRFEIREVARLYERSGGIYERFAARYERLQDYTSGPRDIRAVAGLYEWFVLIYER
ncbi:hypothetical protein [Sporosarcina cyprini]|uniref:hypothetical protein n=1 Tax=Sporosarcina cyprini TaxID=2910523 RepID=UPI001EDF08ED|nr:hypothetical protein [Sporosarcina cyprini]MCG3086763.1 hypothetical protein [Sporosarcina cyprini]